VEVKGTLRADGSVDANEIEVRQGAAPPARCLEFEGVIQSLPNSVGFIGDWVVSGRTIHVTSSTRIDSEDGPIVVGANAEVEGCPRQDGSIDASEIEVEQQAQFEFVGPITSLPNTSNLVGDWVVGGRTVHVTASTRIDPDEGTPAVGAIVEVKGVLRPDGSVDATRIEVEQAAPGAHCIEFQGVIESLPSTTGFVGDWIVSGRTVHVNSITRIETEGGPVAVGARVEIEGCERADGSIDANEIEVKRQVQVLDCIEFDGVIEHLPATGLIGDWIVSGRTVHVTANTIIKVEEGPVVLGAFVEIKGCPRQDGSLDAGRIEVEREQDPQQPFPFFIFFGTVQTLPPSPFVGDWVVGGRTVHVTGNTRIDHEFRPLMVGSFVKVVGGLRADGSIDAIKVEVKRANNVGRKINFFELFGTVQNMPSSGLVGDWRISNQIVHVSPTTRFDPTGGSQITVGSRVVVVGTQRMDLTLDAVKIALLRQIDDAQNFVSQNYRDFLSRPPDDGGLAYWTGQITSCGNDQACVRNRRIDVSAAFFGSPEFQLTGFFVERLYQASFGRTPQFVEFMPDTQTISQNIGRGPSVLEANKQAFVADWVKHPAFASTFDDMTNAQFVDSLFARARVTPSAAERDSLINGLTRGTETRASVLRKIADNPAFIQQEFNRAFVLMQYFGYLRRDPDQGGFDFWVTIMNRLNGDFKKAAMVQAFIESPEYNQRFPRQ